MAQTVLVVDDEKNIVNIIAFNLKKEGYNVLTAEDGEQAVEIADAKNPDLILLDIMMPKMDGYEACRKIREKHNMPIIMLTARAEELDKVNGLEMGADDYVTKPFGIRELVARVKANLRRSLIKDSETQKSTNVMEFGNLAIDLDKFEARKSGETLELTFREFELVKFLAQNAGQVFSRETLLERVWGYEYYGDVRTVDVTVRRLREKLEDNPGKPEYIVTKRGVGYYFGGK